MPDIKKNLEEIKNKIAECAKHANRQSDSVKLIAVSKFHPAESVIEAIENGQTVFGENRVQEASAKFDEIRKNGKNPELHIIGYLQRNKVKEAVRISSCIESVDRIELMDEIEKQCAKIEKKIEILLEVHTGEESKSGFVSEEDIKNALSKCINGDYPHIIPKGFMTMAPNTENESLIRQSFSYLRELSKSMQEKYPSLDLKELSMGMSCDYLIAIEEGATIVRVGTAIFGARNY